MRGGKRTLTRGGRIGRNLALTALMGGMIWLGAGAPAPTAELALRRLERESFLSPHSQYQGVLEAEPWGPWALGLTDRWLVFGGLNQTEQFYLWPRPEGDGPVLAPEPMIQTEPRQVVFAAAGVPEGTAAAELELEVACWHTTPYFTCANFDQDWRGKTPVWWTHTYRAQGEAAGPGAFQFRFVIGDGDEPWGAREAAIQDTALQKAAEWRLYQGQDLPQSLPLRCRGTAVFYDAGGRELGRAVLESRDSQGICVP